MLRLFIYREITGDSYRTLETYQELADHVPSPGTGMQPALVGRIQSRQGRAGGPALPTRSSSTVKPTSGRPRGRLPRPTGSISATERRRRKIGFGGDLPRLLVGLDSWSASLVSRCADLDNPTTPPEDIAIGLPCLHRESEPTLPQSFTVDRSTSFRCTNRPREAETCGRRSERGRRHVVKSLPSNC
jgi:hypothetical protein